MKRKVKRFDEGGYAALLANAQAYDREREGLPPMDDSESNDKGYSGSEAIQDESGIVSKLRRNTETGDVYNPEGNFPALSSKTKARSAAAPVTRVSKATRIEPIISEARNKQMIADMKSEEAAEKVIRDKEWNKIQNEFDEKKKKAVFVGSSPTLKQGMRTRTEEEKAMGAKTLEEGLPYVVSPLRGLKYAKGALDELRTVNAARQLAGPSSQRMLSAPAKRLTASYKPKPGPYPFKSGGSVSSASSRGDGIAQRGKTRGRMY